ncbi:hypothetical protein CR513_03627, partial [Mucuna pruriens]
MGELVGTMEENINDESVRHDNKLLHHLKVRMMVDHLLDHSKMVVIFPGEYKNYLQSCNMDNNTKTIY